MNFNQDCRHTHELGLLRKVIEKNISEKVTKVRMKDLKKKGG